MRLYSAWLFFLLLFIKSTTTAQQYQFRNIGADKGFDAGASYDLMQDGRGYIWISTAGNLYKYNGKTLKGYNDDNKAFSNRNIFGTFEDNTGRVFYFPADSRLGYIRNDSCFIPPFSDSLSSCLKGARLFVLTMGDYDSNRFILSTQNGFYLVNREKLDGLTYLKAPDTISLWIRIINNKAFGSNYPEARSSGQNANLMVSLGTKDVVIPIDRQEGPAPGTFTFRCVKLKDGRVLVAVQDKLVTVYPDGTTSSMKLSKRLIALHTDHTGDLWLGYYKGGVAYYKGADLGKEPETMLDGFSITSFLRDHEGGIWVSTQEENVLYCPSFAIMNFTNHPDLGKTGMGLSKVDQSILTGNTTAKTYRFLDKRHYQVYDYSKFKEVAGVYSFVRHHDKIYAAGYGASFILDKSYNFLDYLYYDQKIVSHLYYIVNTKNNGLMGLSYDRPWFIRDNNLAPGPGVISRARDIYTDTTGRVYVGTVHGLFLLEGDTLTPVEEVPYTVVRIRCFNEDKIWVTTETDGVMLVQGTKVLKRYQSAQGLSPGAYNDIAMDNKGNTWIAGDKGLFCLGPDEKIRAFTRHDGFPTDLITRVLANGNELYLRTTKGLCIADLSLLKPNLTPPKLYLDSVLYNGKRTFRGSFGHERCNLIFYASGISYFDPQGVKYRYRVRGLDTAWQSNSAGEITLSNLDHGSYTLEICALSANGVISNTASYLFVVETPFWLTWWFILLEAAVGSGLIYLLVKWRINVVREKEKEKTAMHKMIAEHQMSALRAQMNPHFLFNAINSIQRYILKKNQQQAYDYLAKFSKLIRTVLDNSEQKVLMLSQELEMIRLYVEMEQLRFNNSFTFSISMAQDINEYETPIPAIILQPYVENAIWHGLMNLEKDKKGILKLDVLKEEGLLKIVIEDNGVGREQSKKYRKEDAHKPVGMRLTEERLKVINQIREYGEARVQVIDLNDGKGNALGTRVEIYLPV